MVNTADVFLYTLGMVSPEVLCVRINVYTGGEGIISPRLLPFGPNGRPTLTVMTEASSVTDTSGGPSTAVEDRESESYVQLHVIYSL